METGYARRSARVILVDGQGRVLLFKAHKNIHDHSQGSLWFTPGGGVEDGEELQVAAARELSEETGLTVAPDELGPIVACSEGHADIQGMPRGQYVDTYFFWQVDALEVDMSGQTEFEASQLIGSRWWAPADLRLATEEIVPRPLADLVEQLCAGSIPSEPVVIPWHL